eukprot:8496865-Pyramimonas_sp.AAC.1
MRPLHAFKQAPRAAVNGRSMLLATQRQTMRHAPPLAWVFATLVTSVLDVGAPHVLYNSPQVRYISAPLHIGPNPDGCVPNEGTTSEVVNGHEVSSGNFGSKP